MKKKEDVIATLNDLIRINNDRIEGYEKEAHEEKNKDPEIRNAFYRIATESRSFVNDLHAEVLRLGGVPVSRTTISGKIYLFWLDMKANFLSGYTGNDIYGMLAACESGEDAIQAAYKEALASAVDFPENIELLIDRQYAALRKSHDLIKSYREEQGVGK